MAHHGHHSDSTSQIASVTAFSEPPFPTVYRREKEEAAGELNVSRPDGSVSMFSTRAGETLLSQDRPRDKHDKLAPIPENRRLGYLSVAALIINKMIGMSSTSRAHTKLTPMIQQGLEYSRPPAQSLPVPAAAKAPRYYFGFLVRLAHWLGENSSDCGYRMQLITRQASTISRMWDSFSFQWRPLHLSTGIFYSTKISDRLHVCMSLCHCWQYRPELPRFCRIHCDGIPARFRT